MKSTNSQKDTATHGENLPATGAVAEAIAKKKAAALKASGADSPENQGTPSGAPSNGASSDAPGSLPGAPALPESSAPGVTPQVRIPAPSERIVAPKPVENPVLKHSKDDPDRPATHAEALEVINAKSVILNAQATQEKAFNELREAITPEAFASKVTVTVKQSWFVNFVAVIATAALCIPGTLGWVWMTDRFQPNRTVTMTDKQVAETNSTIANLAPTIASQVNVPKVDTKPIVDEVKEVTKAVTNATEAVSESTKAVTDATKAVTESANKPVTINAEQFAEIEKSVKELFASLESKSGEIQDALAVKFNENMVTELGKLRFPDTAEIAKATSRATWDMATTGIQRDGTSDGTIFFSLQKGLEGEAAFRWEKAEESKPESKTAATPSGQ